MAGQAAEFYQPAIFQINPYAMKPNQSGHLRRAFKKPKEKKVWQSWHLFPFGKYKGVTLAAIAESDPGHLEWWRDKSKIIFSEPLTQLITDAKNLSK